MAAIPSYIPSGLTQENFRSSIYGLSLRFRDPELEQLYTKARGTMKLTPQNSALFVFVAILGYVLLFASTMAMNTGIGSAGYFELVPALFSLVVVTMVLLEVLCFCGGQRFRQFRGVWVTVFGCLSIFINNVQKYEDLLYYPYIGIGYHPRSF